MRYDSLIDYKNTLPVDCDQSLWTIYNKPSDYPMVFTARRFIVWGDEIRATGDVHHASSLEEIRALVSNGRALIPRGPDNSQTVVEAWF